MKNQNLIRYGAVALSLLIASASASFADPKVDKAFDRQDADGSGGISYEEFEKSQKHWAKTRGKKQGKSEEAIEEQMAKIEKNAPKRFDKVDTDGDGELSKEEFTEMRKKNAKK
jgi:Ca2+-binding EF-hand superfamily protein